tara:strand:+ start:86 stop:283 length:198 start_codon:yes stop_codon:yes gene_type:complete
LVAVVEERAMVVLVSVVLVVLVVIKLLCQKELVVVNLLKLNSQYQLALDHILLPLVLEVLSAPMA